MLKTPFLTLLDPNAKIKGSRDPLGLQPIWTRFGRQVVHNLTTVTTSVREFTTLLLGLFFAEQAIELGLADEIQFVESFLKFEQLAAYSRYAWRDKTGDDEIGIRGIQRVKSNLSEGKGRVRISGGTKSQILSNQKTYGLWGLYTVAARNSGWVDQSTPRLTPIARDFVEREYLQRLDSRGDRIMTFLRADHDFEPRGKDARSSQRLAEVLGPQLTPSEKPCYTRHLLAAGEESGSQQALWQEIKAVNRRRPFRSDRPFSMPELRELIKRCRVSDDALLARLAQQLEHIGQVETVIAPTGLLFGFALARDRQSLTHIVREIRSTWGRRLPHLDPEAFGAALATLDEGIAPDMRFRLTQVAEAMSAGDYLSTLRLLLEQNTAVMKERGGNAWIRLGHKDMVDVRFRDETSLILPGLDELPNLWMNNYFLNSLKQIGFQIEGQAV